MIRGADVDLLPNAPLTESDAVSEAAAVLARLNADADAVRVELTRLRAELAELRRTGGGPRFAVLREANEQLVIAAMDSETTAETAARNLEKVARSAARDVLTDTPNRAVALDRLENAIHLARRRDTWAAVMFVDIDGLKQINDSLGHAAGDEVLRIVARTLGTVVRASDTVSRHGGDEFLLVLTEIAHAGDAALVAEKIMEELAGVRDALGDPVIVSASIGIAIFPGDGDDAATLIAHADAAMYRAKRARSGSYEFFADHSPDRSREPIRSP